MNTRGPRNAGTLIVLAAFECILAFSLGVFGNKVADLLKVSPAIVIAAVALLMILLVSLTVLRIRYERGESLVPGTLSAFLSTIFAVFPVGMLAGIILTAIIILLISGERAIIIPSPFPKFGLFMHDYEVISYVVGTCLVLLLIRRNPGKGAIVMFALGWALGSAATVLFLSPVRNMPTFTFVSTALLMTLTALLLSSRWFAVVVQRFNKSIASQSQKP